MMSFIAAVGQPLRLPAFSHGPGSGAPALQQHSA